MRKMKIIMIRASAGRERAAYKRVDKAATALATEKKGDRSYRGVKIGERGRRKVRGGRVTTEGLTRPLVE